MLPTTYSQFIHLSRYARWDDSVGRRETWDETVDRYFNFFVPYLNEHHNDGPNPMDVGPLREAIINLQVMPSMRCLMTAGNALSRDHLAGYNPVSGKTPVLTREHGMVPIEQLSKNTATVLNRNGDWTEATFNSYGTQDTYTVSLKLNSNTLNNVDCTKNHRWVLENGQRYDGLEFNKGLGTTGCHELAMVAWNALALMVYDLRDIGTNDLPITEQLDLFKKVNAVTSHLDQKWDRPKPGDKS